MGTQNAIKAFGPFFYNDPHSEKTSFMLQILARITLQKDSLRLKKNNCCAYSFLIAVFAQTIFDGNAF